MSPGTKKTIASLRLALKTKTGMVWVADSHSNSLDGDEAALLEIETRRMNDLRSRERLLQAGGTRSVAGVDEAGRGPLAGPVVAAAVILPPDRFLPGVNDSKKLSEPERELLYFEITDGCDYGVGIAGPGEIDDVNILQATYLAMQRALGGLKNAPHFVLADAVTIPAIPFPQEGIIGGDALCACIAAASIVAKVTRDRLMRQYDSLYPQYGFANHKGYGTPDHLEALRLYGPCPIHRRSFHYHLREGRTGA